MSAFRPTPRWLDDCQTNEIRPKKVPSFPPPGGDVTPCRLGQVGRTVLDFQASVRLWTEGYIGQHFVRMCVMHP